MEIVDDEYWLGYARKQIENIDTIGTSYIDRLEKFILWLWVIYTATFALAGTFLELDESVLILIILAAPILLLLIAYGACIWAQQPIAGQFDEGSPDEIRNYFNFAIRIRHIRQRIASGVALFACLIVAVALFSYKFSHTKKNSHEPEVVFDTLTQNIFVNAYFEKPGYVILYADSINNSESQMISVYKDTLRSFEGSFKHRFRLQNKCKKIRVSVGHKNLMNDNSEKWYVFFFDDK